MSQSTTTPEPEYQKRGRSKKPMIIGTAIVAVIAVAALVTTLALRSNADSTGSQARELVVGLTLEPTNLDIRTTGGVALDQVLIDNVYQGLIGFESGSTDTYVPVLANELPKISSDGRTYTFVLRDGATFHSGSSVTATDVVESYSATLTADLLGYETTVEATDERTIVITLAEPNSQLLWHLANRPGLVFEAAYTGDLATTANGTGPYTVENWKQGDSLTFNANENYWGASPELDRVVWRYIPDGTAAVNAALDGDLDVLAPVVSSMTEQINGNESFTLVRAASTDVFTLGYNTLKAPLNDLRVRTALSQAIDSEAIIAAFYGDGKALGGPITDIEAGYENLTSINAYDPENAKALLAEAGVENLSLTLTVPNFYAGAAIDQIVSQFAAVGVTLTVDQVEFPTWLSDVYAEPEDGTPRTFDISYVDHAEANDFANYVTPGYYFGTTDAEAVRLYEESLRETDPEVAASLIAEAARIVAEDAPAKWLINYTPTNAIGTNVSGFPENNTNSRINLEGVSIIKE